MKKVVCNVLYETTLPVYDKKFGVKNELNVGIFGDKKSALVSAEILRIIFQEADINEYGISFVYEKIINEKFVPESRMNNPLIKDSLVSGVDDFVKRNYFVVDFVNKKGQQELQELIDVAEGRISLCYAKDKDVFEK